MKQHHRQPKVLTLVFLIGAAVLAACSPAAPAEPAQPAPESAPVTVQYTLRTAAEGNQLLFIGVGGDIDGQVNPDLVAQVGDTVAITLINDDGRSHDVVIREFDAATPVFGTIGQEETVEFVVDQAGTFFYFCSVSGHRQAGMEGQLIVSAGE
jgi:nitrite reductase (NO-forming)